MDILTSPANVKAEITHIQKCADALPAPNSKMLLFSFVPSNQKTTFLTSVISHLLDSGIHSFSISKLTSYLNDYTLVKNDLINFYFDSSTVNNLDFDHVICNSRSIPDKIKVLLFSFLMYPQKYTSSLIHVIDSYYTEIKNRLLSPLNNNTDLNLLYKYLTKRSSQQSRNLNISSPIGYSLSYCVRDYLAFDFTSVPPYFISTEITINDYNNSPDDSVTFSELTDLCRALGDKIRMSILNSVLTQNNITIEEISENIGLTVNATKYHITLLKKVGLLSSTRLHRKILYSFNPAGFQNIKKLLDSMERGGLS